MKTRLHEEKNVLTPKNPLEWDALMSKAILKAEKNSDRRLAGLRRAIQNGRSELVLRSFGIISESDLQREFQELG